MSFEAIVEIRVAEQAANIGPDLVHEVTDV